MKRTTFLATFVVAAVCLATSNIKTYADVVLTFDQSGIADFVDVDQAYGDAVISSPDGNGHAYDIITGNGLGLTPNVQVEYNGGTTALWTTGYGDLTNVLFDDDDFNTGFEVEFTADTGFEVGLFGFDLAAFAADLSLPGVEVLDGDDNVLWSVGATDISSTTHNSFDTGGLFAESLTIAIDLTGLGGTSDNLGIDNIHFGQRVAAVPEPTGACVLLAGLLGLISRRRR